MDERMQFVAAWLTGLYEMTQLCNEYGVSRKTGYKWLERYETLGPAGLEDRSRAPHRCSHKTPEQIRQALINERKRHPHWGARKLLVQLAKQSPELFYCLPAASTATAILSAAGLVEQRRKRRREHHPGAGPLVANAANDVWCADYKGEFVLGDRKWCYPLTVSDAHSRYLVGCQGTTSVGFQHARRIFEHLFRGYGCPLAIRTDNGAPFCSNALGGISRLSVFWTKLGIVHQRIHPGSPQENGAHERMHKTLKAETTRPPGANMTEQQNRFDLFRAEYNDVRPHEALDMATPASLWQPSARAFPDRLPAPEYAGHMSVRCVRTSGEIKFLGRLLFVSEVLRGEQVALEATDEGVWSLYFYKKLLARLDVREWKLAPLRKKGARPPDRNSATGSAGEQAA